MTNFHVIRGASNIKVALIDSSVYPARVRSALLLTSPQRKQPPTHSANRQSSSYRLVLWHSGAAVSKLVHSVMSTK